MNKNIVVIVESPAKCKKIEGFLGHGYRCIASFGHIRTLQSLNDVDINNDFNPTFKTIESKESHIRKLTALIKTASEVVLATDDDREGEAIAWHICQLFKLPVSTTKRIIFHEITKNAIQNAILHPTHIDMYTVHAQQARQIIDIIVGFKLSPILWSQIARNNKKGLSAGRCQTPALRIIYENQKEIDKSPGKMAYNTTGYFTDHTLPFVLNHTYTECEEIENFLEESIEFEYKYQCGKVRKTTKNPPKPFTTSRLQQTANTEIRCSPKETMSLCQKLYENGFITYMRTDSEIYSKEFLEKSKNYVEGKWDSNYVRKDLEKMGEKKGKKKDDNAQEAHEAIRPTEITRTEIDEDFSPKERKMYKLIWRNTLETCMATANYNAITSTITAPFNKEYRYSTELVVFPGWKVVAGYEIENPIYEYLRNLKSVISYKKIVAKVTVKELKSHYTEAKLVQILEEKGIGRPSTFASLIEKIQERGYVKRDNVKGSKIKCIDYELIENELLENETEREFGNEKNKLVIQSVGTMVIEFLLAHFPDLFEYDYTKNMENDLDKIAKNELIWHTVCRKCLQEIDKTPTIQKKKQYVIDENHTYMIGKYGPVIKYSEDGGETVKFKNVKKDLDITKLENGEYTLDEILLEKEATRNLGNYEGEDVVIRNGKYGYYAQWGSKKISLSKIGKDILEVTIDDIVNNKPTDVVRIINDDISIRKSKYGLYIFYKKKNDKKPKFISLKKFTDNIETCDDSIIIEYVNNN
jgi:DNA topoisomerase I